LHLNEIRPDMTDLVVCPLCLDHFGREALLGDPPILSVEHPIPSAVEGEFKTLTCRKCNNTAGAILDSHFVQMIPSYDWVLGSGPGLKGTIRVGDAALPMNLSWGGEGNVNAIRIPGGRASEIADFQQKMKSLRAGETIDLEDCSSDCPSLLQGL